MASRWRAWPVAGLAVAGLVAWWHMRRPRDQAAKAKAEAAASTCSAPASPPLLSLPRAASHGARSWPPPEADAQLIRSLPPSLLRQRTFRYDPDRYPFRSLVASIIAPAHPPGELERLHLGEEALDRYDGGKRLVGKHSNKRTQFSKRWRTRERDCRTAALAAEFRRVLGLFVEEVVTPLLFDGGSGGGTPTTVFQREPTLRCHMPGLKATGARHRDYSYKRQPTEVNVWLPVTGPIAGTNGLYAESEPGKGDFSPFECAGQGEAIIFFGNQCEHYSVPNETDITRVSIDFRVIRGDLFVEDYVAPWIDDDVPRFRRGFAYTDCEEERVWREQTPSGHL